jgi:hypothetical protein
MKSSSNVNTTVVLIRSQDKDIKEAWFHTGIIIEKLKDNKVKVKYDSYSGTGEVPEDNIIVVPRRRQVKKVESYKDLNDDDMDIEMKLERDEEVYDENKEWEVDDILGRRINLNPSNGLEEVEFLVKWKDCKGIHDNTWETYKKLSENKLLLEYIEEWMLIQQRIKIEVNALDDETDFDSSDDEQVEKHFNLSLE